MMGFTLLYLSFSCFPSFIPRNIQPKNEGDLPLNSLVEEKETVFCSFLGFTDKSGDTAQPRISAAIVLSVCFILSHTPSFAWGRNIYLIWQVYVFLFFPGDLTVHFFPWKGQSVFQKFQPWVFEKLIRVACLSLFTVLKRVLAIFT